MIKISNGKFWLGGGTVSILFPAGGALPPPQAPLSYGPAWLVKTKFMLAKMRFVSTPQGSRGYSTHRKVGVCKKWEKASHIL